MSYFPSYDNPYAQHPTSPVPSYQYSTSQSSVGVISSPSSAASSWQGASQLPQPPSTPSSSTDDTVDSFKTQIESSRERRSNSRALLLLEQTAGEDNSSSNITSLKSEIDFVREKGANLRALALLNETSEAIKRNDPPVRIVRARSSSTHTSSGNRTVPPEKLAESTRKLRALTADDIKDPETVAGMKCNLDIAREQWAKKRALFLMDFGSFV